jgi:hypothetical protein
VAVIAVQIVEDKEKLKKGGLEGSNKKIIIRLTKKDGLENKNRKIQISLSQKEKYHHLA